MDVTVKRLGRTNLSLWSFIDLPAGLRNGTGALPARPPARDYSTMDLPTGRGRRRCCSPLARGLPPRRSPYYRLRSPRPELEWVRRPGTDGHRRSPPPPAVRRFVEPVLLCHGLAANHVNFDFDPPHSLAHAFAAAGFEVFTVDWRGAGDSRPPRLWQRFDFDADDLIDQDAPALLAHALERTGAPRPSGSATRWARWWATPSWEDRTERRVRGHVRPGGAGLLPLPGWVVRLLRLALWLAWPVAFRQRWLSIGLAPFLGHVTLPLTEVLLNPKAIAPRVLRKMYCNLVSSMGYRLLRQLDDWSSTTPSAAATGASTTASASAG